MKYLLLLLIFTWFSPAIKADIQWRLVEPNWHFELDNRLNYSPNMQLSLEEKAKLQSYQALLDSDQKIELINRLGSELFESTSPLYNLICGQIMMSLDQLLIAETALTTAYSKNPSDIGINRSLGFLFLLKKKYQLARNHLTLALQLGAQDAQTFAQLSYVNLQLKKFASAISGYQHALFLEPDHFDWQQGLVYSLTQTGSLVQAQSFLEQLLTENMTNRSLWVQRSQLAYQLSQFPQAIASLEHAIELGERNLENISATALLHLNHGSPRRAVALYQEFSKQLIDHQNFQLYTELARHFVDVEAWLQLASLTKPLQAQFDKLPDMVKAQSYYYQGLIARHQQKSNQNALQLFEKATSLDWTNGDILLAQADLERSEKMYTSALLHLTRAEALPDYQERAIIARAQIAIEQSNHLQALKLLRRLIHQFPHRVDLLEHIHSLESIIKAQD